MAIRGLRHRLLRHAWVLLIALLLPVIAPRLPVGASLTSMEMCIRDRGGVDLGGHVGELEGDRLVAGDRLAEGVALEGVVASEFESRPGDPESTGGDLGAGGLCLLYTSRCV